MAIRAVCRVTGASKKRSQSSCRCGKACRPITMNMCAISNPGASRPMKLGVHLCEAKERCLREVRASGGGRRLDVGCPRCGQQSWISYFVGGRDGECAEWFIQDVADRVANGVQLTRMVIALTWRRWKARSARHRLRNVVKLYGATSESSKGRYSPAECIGNRSIGSRASPT